MKNKISQRLFCITLFMQFCLPIFSGVPQAPQGSLLTHTMQDRDTFEAMMTMSREHTQNIGFCVQQIIQTLDAGKIKLSKPAQMHVISQLMQIQELVKIMTEELYVQNSRAALYEGILLNNAIIHFMLNVTKKGLPSIQITQLMAQLQKKSQKNLPEDLIFNMLQGNAENLEKLTYATDHLGLTWYNSFYRGLKKYNAYSVVKLCAVGAVATVIAGYVLCISDSRFNESGPLKNWVGKRPKYDQHGDFHYLGQEGIPSEKRIPMESEQSRANGLIPTPFQNLVSSTYHLNKAGVISVGALLTFTLQDVIKGLFKDYYDWAQDIGHKKGRQLDKKLSGTEKPNAQEEGYEKVYFKDMVGSEELEQLAKKIANFMKHPERYERAQIEEHRGILLFGPPQTGKTLFAKALRTLIEEDMNDGQKIMFIDAKTRYEQGWTIEYIFWYARYYAPAIVFFDEIDLVGTNREKSGFNTGQILTGMQGIDMASKPVIVIGATNRVEQLDKALMVDGRFGRHIQIEYPEYENRKTFLTTQLAKRCIQLAPEFIDHMAQETKGASYNVLKRIITEAIILSSIETRPVTQADFEKTLDIEFRKIQPAPNAMSLDDRKITATYQAGKAVARHILQTNKEIVKITIHPVLKEVKPTDVGLVTKSDDVKASDNEKLTPIVKESKMKLGEVFTKSIYNHTELTSDAEQEKECLTLLAGSVALKLVLQQSYTHCNKHDRAEAMQIIYSIISQGEKVDDEMTVKALKIKAEYEQKVHKLLEANKELLTKIIDKLMEQYTIDRYQWQNLIKA